MTPERKEEERLLEPFIDYQIARLLLLVARGEMAQKDPTTTSAAQQPSLLHLPEEGELVKNRYKLIELAGVGAFGSVWRGLDLQTNQPVAIKKAVADCTVGQIKDWLQEIAILRSLEHPNIVKYVDHAQTSTHLYMMMEYHEGGSLQRYLKKNGCFKEEDEAFKEILFDILQGLAYLHRKKLFHRDIKAGNVLLNMDGTAVLSDFGLALLAAASQKRNPTTSTTATNNAAVLEEASSSSHRKENATLEENNNTGSGVGGNVSTSVTDQSLESTDLRRHHSKADLGAGGHLEKMVVGGGKNIGGEGGGVELVGSVYWMAPEQIHLQKPGAPADIWAVGCVVIEMLTGKPPFFDRTPVNALYHIAQPDSNPIPKDLKLSPELQSFLNCCFQRDPKDRMGAEDLLRHECFESLVGSPREQIGVGEDASLPSASSFGEKAASTVDLELGESQHKAILDSASKGKTATSSSLRIDKTAAHDNAAEISSETQRRSSDIEQFQSSIRRGSLPNSTTAAPTIYTPDDVQRHLQDEKTRQHWMVHQRGLEKVVNVIITSTPLEASRYFSVLAKAALEILERPVITCFCHALGNTPLWSFDVTQLPESVIPDVANLFAICCEEQDFASMELSQAAVGCGAVVAALLNNNHEDIRNQAIAAIRAALLRNLPGASDMFLASSAGTPRGGVTSTNAAQQLNLSATLTYHSGSNSHHQASGTAILEVMLEGGILQAIVSNLEMDFRRYLDIPAPQWTWINNSCEIILYLTALDDLLLLQCFSSTASSTSPTGGMYSPSTGGESFGAGFTDLSGSRFQLLSAVTESCRRQCDSGIALMLRLVRTDTAFVVHHVSINHLLDAATDSSLDYSARLEVIKALPLLQDVPEGRLALEDPNLCVPMLGHILSIPPIGEDDEVIPVFINLYNRQPSLATACSSDAKFFRVLVDKLVRARGLPISAQGGGGGSGQSQAPSSTASSQLVKVLILIKLLFMNAARPEIFIVNNELTANLAKTLEEDCRPGDVLQEASILLDGFSAQMKML